MELTIEQALELGITAHKQGRLQDAEQYYRAILQFQPNHPDANHNLGVLAVSLDKALMALPFFKTALNVNPSVEQFWLSYIDALVKEQQIDSAREAIKQAREQGADTGRLGSLETQLIPIDENLRDNAASPPQELIDSLLELYQNQKLSEAEELALTIKIKFPNHQFAWKVLGALYSASGRQLEALNANQTAVKLKPEDAGAHSNLGNVLKELGRKDEAVSSYMQAIVLDPDFAEAHSNLGVIFQELGRLDAAVGSYDKAVTLKPDFVLAHYNLGNALQELGRLEDAEVSFRNAIAARPAYAEAYNNLGVTLKGQCRLTDAEKSYRQAIKHKPDFAEAYNNLGITLKELERYEEAEDSFNFALALDPKYTTAYYNLGVTLQYLDRLEEAEDKYRKAIALNSNYAEAHCNLGLILQSLGRLSHAETSYRRAIALEHNYAEAHGNLGNTLREQGRMGEALDCYRHALALKPKFPEVYINLAITIKNVRFKSTDSNLYPQLTQLLTEGNFTRPKDIAKSILSLLKHDSNIADFLNKKQPLVNIEDTLSIIRKLDNLPLLHQLMRLCPLPELQFERLFIEIRGAVLNNLNKITVSPEFIYFISSLAQHCFINEYIYTESNQEKCLITELENDIKRSIAETEQPEAIKILCLSCYRPLHKYNWCNSITSIDNIEDIKKRLIEEPLLERAIAQNIKILNKVDDKVSLAVKDQYEINPYPRWLKLAIPIKAKTVGMVCDELKLQIHSESITRMSAPNIFIAGCGTGQHAIETANRFINCHVTALDLSVASLAYAQRKTKEMGLTNIDYLQGDILHLAQLGKKFQIIESLGVLHHMNDPMTGWRILTDLMEAGGLIKIALYSASARQHISRIREEIARAKVMETEIDIREYRRELANSSDHDHQLLKESSDFYSVSTLRDLIFHVQEHQFTLPLIKNHIDELGLKFCGFENQDIDNKFMELYGTNADINDLSLWHQFEKIHPSAFAGMYQFWCQKL